MRNPNFVWNKGIKLFYSGDLGDYYIVRKKEDNNTFMVKKSESFLEWE